MQCVPPGGGQLPGGQQRLQLGVHSCCEALQTFTQVPLEHCWPQPQGGLQLLGRQT